VGGKYRVAQRFRRRGIASIPLPRRRIQAALPLRVVRDDDTGVVAWMTPGTTIMYWAMKDGRDPRSLPLEERFDQTLSTAQRTWEGNGVLRVMPRGTPFQVLHFWDGLGGFVGWYVNFEAPPITNWGSP
jgi:hypothetical protein